MGGVLARLDQLDAQLRAGQGHPLLGTGSLHASIIEGGREYSSYPASCILTAERRTIPGESLEQVEAEMRALLADVPGRSRLIISRPPFEVGVDDPFVELVRDCAGGAELAGMAFWADSGLFADAGIPTVLYGPRGEGAHADVEWVDVESGERCLEVYVSVARALCA